MGVGKNIENSNTKRFEVALVDGQIASAMRMYATEVTKQNWPTVKRMEEAMSSAAVAVDDNRRHVKTYTAALFDEGCSLRDSDRERNGARVREIADSGMLTAGQMVKARWAVKMLLELERVREENGALTQKQIMFAESIERRSVMEDIEALAAHISDAQEGKSLAQRLREGAGQRLDMFKDAIARKFMDDELRKFGQELERRDAGTDRGRPGSVVFAPHDFLDRRFPPSKGREDPGHVKETDKKDPNGKDDSSKGRPKTNGYGPDFGDIKRD